MEYYTAGWDLASIDHAIHGTDWMKDGVDVEKDIREARERLGYPVFGIPPFKHKKRRK